MSFNLFKFRPPWSLQNQGLNFLDKKTSFSINFCPKTILGSVINLLIISKKIKETKNQSGFMSIFL